MAKVDLLYYSHALKRRGLFDIVEMKMTETNQGLTRMDAVKADYDACRLTYEAALDKLQALGMWEDDADDFLVPLPAKKAASK